MPPLPITQKRGDKLIESSPNLPWYKDPTLLDALDQIQVPNGGKSIKSSVMKRGKQVGAVMVNGVKKFGTAMVNGVKRFETPCLNASVAGAVQELGIYKGSAPEFSDLMGAKNVVSWTTMFEWFLKKGNDEMALSIFFTRRKMCIPLILALYLSIISSSIEELEYLWWICKKNLGIWGRRIQCYTEQALLCFEDTKSADDDSNTQAVDFMIEIKPNTSALLEASPKISPVRTRLDWQ
ncbi:hypothetical protein FEM48_Zijuj07G0064000 [Ziziphus jujuba var. spinosa]|uniref:Uncharacterized protein n=1 Tax=Ziziphus jujuba var. spinosa TaxID=714518 RepID=A0A978V301_ZIZJJ|nr:hypothetical protein FEM48_Zijuj07G0064000 [Ziziphus jujuba var. spinosa]